MPETRLGINSKLFVNEGSYGTPEWTEIDLVADFSITGAWDLGDSSARRSLVKTSEPTMLDMSGNGRVRKDSSDAGWNLLRDAFINRTPLDILELDGDVDEDGSTGFRYDAKITSFGEDQAMANVLYNDFALTPCASDNAPKAVIVEEGEPVFSDIGGPEGS